MEVQFDYKGKPLGGKIINYLLEKVRVVAQMPVAVAMTAVVPMAARRLRQCRRRGWWH